MQAAALNAIFGTGFSPVKQVTFPYTFNTPTGPIANPAADVQEQQRGIDVAFNAATGVLSLVANAAGDGLWIPYLGNGSGGDGAKGWGTYTGPVGAVTWVATGKFSGCSVGMFSGATRRFAHLITPAAGHPCATVPEQVAAISAATGLATAVTYKPPTPVGEAIAFMLFLNGVWCKRIVQVSPGSPNVVAINAQSTPLT